MSTRRNVSVKLLLALFGAVLFAQSSQADPISWRNNLDAAKLEASKTGKLILVHFHTASCGPCKKLERDVFSQPQIAVAMERDYIPVKLNADQSPALANAFQITRVPTEVVLNAQGSILQKLSCPLEPAAYGSQLVNVAQHYGGRTTTNRLGITQTPVHSAYAGLKIAAPAKPVVAAAALPATRTPVRPVVTQNPYATAAQPAMQQMAAAPVAQQQPRVSTVPANAMPNSYRDRYAAVATAVATQAPIAQQPPITPTPSTPPMVAATVATSTPHVTPQVAATTPATVNSATVKPEAWPPALPAGTPSLAFDGFCPVSLQQAQKWVRGNKTFGAIHRDRTYLFASDAQRQKFLADPDTYSPVFSGNDPVKMLDENLKTAGSRKFGCAYRGAFYLFSSQESMARFAKQPDRYAAGVRQAMKRMDATGGETLRR